MERRNDRDILRLLKDNKISDANKLLNKIILEQKEKDEEKPIKFSYFFEINPRKPFMNPKK